MNYNIGKFIEFIIDLVNENDIFYNNTNIDSRYYFLNGGCFDLYKIVHHYFNDANAWIRKDLKHCAIEYQGKLYDASGIIENPLIFFPAKEEDLLYMERQFGLEIKGLEPEQIEKEIDQCRVKGILY